MWSSARSLPGAVAVARRSRRCCLRRRAGAPRCPLGLAAALAVASHSAAAPPWRRLALMVCKRPLWSSAWSLPLRERSPSRGARGAPACGAALALLAPAWSCHRYHGSVTLCRHSSAAAASSFSTVHSAWPLALSACGRRRGRFLSGAVAVARRLRRRCLRRRAGAPGAGLVVPPRSRRHDARPPLFRGGG